MINKKILLVLMCGLHSSFVHSNNCMTLNELLDKYKVNDYNEIKTTIQLKNAIFKNEASDIRNHYAKFIGDVYPIFNIEVALNSEHITWVDSFLSSDMFKKFDSVMKNKNIIIDEQLPFFNAKYEFAKKISTKGSSIDDQLANGLSIVLSKDDITFHLAEFDGLKPNNKDYFFNQIDYIYLESSNKLVVKVEQDINGDLLFEHINFEKKNFDGHLDSANCGIQVSNHENLMENNSAKNLHSIQDIIDRIKSDPLIIEYISNPGGMCFNAAEHIRKLLSYMGIPLENIKYRLNHYTINGLDWIEVNIKNNGNHMVVVLEQRGEKYIFDPTILQFPMIDNPFYGTESQWFDELKPFWNGHVQKKAFQYIDYSSYYSAANASTTYRIDFDLMTKSGGTFLNRPKWYDDFFAKYNTPTPPKSKVPKFLMCLKSKTND